MDEGGSQQTLLVRITCCSCVCLFYVLAYIFCVVCSLGPPGVLEGGQVIYEYPKHHWKGRT
jgi:hypothetical protein